MTAAVTFSHNAASMLRVYINDTLHLAFSTEKMAGLQSWEMTTRDPPLFCIEVTMASGEPIVTEYATRDLWLSVLHAINQAFGVSGSSNQPQTTNPASS